MSEDYDPDEYTGLDSMGILIIKLIAVAAAAFWLVMAAIGLASGQPMNHEHANADIHWIQKNHPGCCGKEDCAPVPPDKISWTPNGYNVDGQIVPPRKTKPGKVSQPTACFHLDTMVVRCLFIPRSGG